MNMNPAMLLFGLIDSGVAFFFVYYMIKARFGGNQKPLARILAAILGTIVFAIYFAVIVWFNTAPQSTSLEVKLVVYLAPFVLSGLMVALVLLSQPPKDSAEEQTDTDAEKDINTDADETAVENE